MGKHEPPVAVLRRADGYYVLDGRHRVSVALALGHHDIEAWVTHSGPVVTRDADAAAASRNH